MWLLMLVVLVLIWLGILVVCLGLGYGWGLWIFGEVGIYGWLVSLVVIVGVLFDGVFGVGLLFCCWCWCVLLV